MVCEKERIKTRYLSQVGEVELAAIGRNLLPVKHTIIPDNARHTQAIVFKYYCPALTLGGSMLRQLPPLRHSLFIPPERER